MQEVELQTPEIESILSNLLNRNVTSMEGIGGGRNSKVYRLTCAGSSKYAAKVYFRHGVDDRDRLGAEFCGLRFLWENGVRCIPRPIVADRDHGCAVYEYVDGQKIASQEVTGSDIDDAVQFLVRLEGLRNKKGSEHLPLASEACFSVQAIVNNIEQRLSKLTTICNDDVPYPALREFLKNEFIPALDEITKWCKSNLNQPQMSFASDIGREEKTLSPSDFGFHNALRCSDGRIVFLDFEYFGWDDPAKMTSDFLLHPAVELSESLRRQFVTKILTGLAHHRYLAKRVEIVFPLFGLKWCLILLNEFLPEHLLRRGFASGCDLDKNDLQAQQLSKAKRMLHRIMRDYEHFPYRD